MAGGSVAGNRGSPAERFWAKVDKSPHPKGCWTWTAARDGCGYGQFGSARHVNLKVFGIDKKILKAHRVSYILAKGHPPPGLQVIHTCDNPACVNPDHLLVGTHKQNMDDRDQKRRQAFGERMGMSKLTVEKVRAIRSEYKTGLFSHADLGLKHGVERSTIKAVVRGRTWQHVAPSQ